VFYLFIIYLQKRQKMCPFSLNFGINRSVGISATVDIKKSPDMKQHLLDQVADRSEGRSARHQAGERSEVTPAKYQVSDRSEGTSARRQSGEYLKETRASIKQAIHMYK
jgi:hypothetical protein